MTKMQQPETNLEGIWGWRGAPRQPNGSAHFKCCVVRVNLQLKQQPVSKENQNLDWIRVEIKKSRVCATNFTRQFLCLLLFRCCCCVVEGMAHTCWEDYSRNFKLNKSLRKIIFTSSCNSYIALLLHWRQIEEMTYWIKITCTHCNCNGLRTRKCYPK